MGGLSLCLCLWGRCVVVVGFGEIVVLGSYGLFGELGWGFFIFWLGDRGI